MHTSTSGRAGTLFCHVGALVPPASCPSKQASNLQGATGVLSSLNVAWPDSRITLQDLKSLLREQISTQLWQAVPRQLQLCLHLLVLILHLKRISAFRQGPVRTLQKSSLKVTLSDLIKLSRPTPRSVQAMHLVPEFRISWIRLYIKQGTPHTSIKVDDPSLPIPVMSMVSQIFQIKPKPIDSSRQSSSTLVRLNVTLTHE